MSGDSTWRLELDELARATGGRILSRGALGQAGAVRGVGTDTRASLDGQAFFALKGETFDANDFLDKAVDAKAAAVVSHDRDAAQALARARGASAAVVLVDDTLVALQSLGLHWRRKMKARILAVTGTNGKTTTKEFAAQILSTRLKTQWSRGSFNNHWGVPISLLSIDPSHEVAMIEMGMNHPGELKDLVRICDPDVVGCTMVGRGHLEGMGSIEGVARGKAEIYERARADAAMIFNVDNEWTRKMMDDALARDPNLRAFRFGAPTLVAEAGGPASGGTGAARSSGGLPLDVCLRLERATEDALVVSGQIGGVAGRAEVPVFGAHNVANLMAASAYALAAGLAPEDVWAALPSCRSAWGRNMWVDLKGGARALFDAYNANPESMGAAIENFRGLAARGRKFAVLGEMREMGEHAAAVHEEMGRLAGSAGFEAIAFVGPSGAAFAAGLKASGYSKTPMLADTYENNVAPQMAPMLGTGDIVLFKASRGVRLEKVLQGFGPLNFANKG